MQGDSNYLVDLTKRKSKTKQRKNTENLSDEVLVTWFLMLCVQLQRDSKRTC